MSAADDDEEKHRMKGQTEVKHDILQKYLEPWLYRISSLDRTVHYIDGFAGWGIYPDGSPGSPLIALSVANQNLPSVAGKLDEFRCTFIEKDQSNFESLNEAVKEELQNCDPIIKAKCENREFEEFAREYLVEEEGAIAAGAEGPPPSFAFIDPFGYSGLPFEVVDGLLNLRETGMEVFVSFMSGEMARFMEVDNHKIPINELLGTDEWENHVNPDADKEERAEQFLRFYKKQLREEAGVDHVWDFRMCREEKAETVYYLVHATNHFKGFKLMKDVMFNAGAEEKFAYLGPDHTPYADEQRKLWDFGEIGDDERILDLADDLHERFVGEPPISLWEIMRQTYDEIPLIQKHYRKACLRLENQGRAEIINHPEEDDGTVTGLQSDDEVRFIEGAGGLRDYL